MHSHAVPPALELPCIVSRRSPAGRSSYLHQVIFFFLVAFVVLLPHLSKAAGLAFLIAFFLWLVRLGIERKGMLQQPLVLPLLAYVALSGISTALSPDPHASWSHMKLVCYTALVVTLFAQNLTKLSQVKILMAGLLLSATAAAALTAWQYTYGIGVRVTAIAPQTELYHAGIRAQDVIVRINGHSVHTPEQLVEALNYASPASPMRINWLRGEPTRRRSVVLPPTPGGRATQGLQLERAKPVRAQGLLGHYIILGEVLMPIGCLAWALMLVYLPQRRRAAAMFAIIFVAITATIFAAETRAALAGLLTGCVVAALLLVRRWSRLRMVAVLILLGAVATLWIHHTRGVGWIASSDPGTQYRWLMWQDGIRLAIAHPLAGVGMDTIQTHWQQWHIRAFQLYHDYWNFHSDFVQIAAERGFLTLTAWLWFVGAYLVYLFRLQQRTRYEARFTRAVVVGIFSGFVAFLVPSLVISTLTDASLEMLIFFCCGTAMAIDRMLPPPPRPFGVMKISAR